MGQRLLRTRATLVCVTLTQLLLMSDTGEVRRQVSQVSPDPALSNAKPAGGAAQITSGLLLHASDSDYTI